MKFLDWVLRERSLTVYLVYDPFKNRQSQSMETGEGVVRARLWGRERRRVHLLFGSPGPAPWPPRMVGG